MTGEKDNTLLALPIREQFVDEIKQIIREAQQNAVRSVDFCRVQMYWHLGKRILEEEQQGKARAEYGSYLIKNLAQRIEPEYGSGFGERQLKFCRQFYREYPIVNALRSQLNWYQYRSLIQIPDHDKREYYELEAVNNAWTGRELQRQIDSMLYERLLLSNDKEAVLIMTATRNCRSRIPLSAYFSARARTTPLSARHSRRTTRLSSHPNTNSIFPPRNN